MNMNAGALTHSLPGPAGRFGTRKPSVVSVLLAAGLFLIFVLITRLPVARTAPIDSDEFGYLQQISQRWFPMHHTLFLTLGRVCGLVCGNAFYGFIFLDMFTSSVALLSIWWWLRALVRPAAATAATLALGVGPVFWGYGAMASNYTAIVAVGGLLLGIAYRGRGTSEAWHPFAAAVVLALGTGYRQDIGTLWLAVFLAILWQHRWRRAILAGLLFTALNLAWLLPMLHESGGWASYRAASAQFAYEAGYLNSVWHLGLVDAPLRYGVKLIMALVWTLGPLLLFVPRGLIRLRHLPDGLYLGFLFSLSVVPALGSHLLVHFGVQGYAFHYLPALMALASVGIGRAADNEATGVFFAGSAPGRLLAFAASLAALFLFYPTDYDRSGWRGSYDLAFARHTRIGLRTPIPGRAPAYWRTANSRALAGTRESSARADRL